MVNTQNLTDTMRWADEYAITHAVIVDELGEIADRYEEDLAEPSFTLFGPGLEVIFRDKGTVQASDITPYLP